MQKRTRNLLLGFLAALLLIVPCSAYLVYHASSTSQVQPIGANVSVIGNQTGIKATPTTANLPFTLQALGPAVVITPGGALKSGPVTLQFKLNQRLSDQKTAVIATSETGTPGSWTLMQPTISSDGWYASVTTSHLSFWQPLLLDLKQAAQDFRKFFLDGLSGDMTTEAEKPTCQNETQARQGYTIDSSAKATLYWCFGVENGTQVLKIVNRMRYPLQVSHPGLTVQHIDGFTLDLEQLARLGSGAQTILYPFEEADYALNLKPGARGGISTDYAGYAQSLYQLETGVSTLEAILGEFGVEDAPGIASLASSSAVQKVLDVMEKLLEVRDCANALLPTPDSGKLISGCFSAAELISALGWKGILLAPIMVVGSVIEFFRSEVSSFVDIFTGTDQYTVVVTRLDLQSIYNSYVGDWHVHGTIFLIYADMTGKSTTNIGPCTGSLQDTSMCSEVDTYGFTVNNDGRLTGTITSIQFTSDDAPYPGTPFGAGTQHVGDQFELVHVPQKSYLLWQTWPGVTGGGYLCASNYSGEECGA